MSMKSEKIFMTKRETYLKWIEEKYEVRLVDLETEFLANKVKGNSVLTDEEADLLGRKIGLFGRPYTPLSLIAEDMKVSKAKVSLMLKAIYLKISVKRQVKK